MNRYQSPSVCAPGEQPGTRIFRNYVSQLFGVPNQQGWNPRCKEFHPVRVGSNRCSLGHTISHHAEGSAFDLMTSDFAKQVAIWQWAIGPEGQNWGVMEVITGYGPAGRPQRWTNGRWMNYRGASPHRDHVHIAITRAAARMGTFPPPLAPPAPKPPVLVTPSSPDQLVKDDSMYSLWKVPGFADLGITGPGLQGKVPSMKIVEDLARAGRLTPGKTPDQPWQEVSQETFLFLTGVNATTPG